MTDEMLAKACEVIAESGFENIEVRKGLIEDLPVDSSSVDWVISNCVINLSPEKEKVFAEIARVLKPGGRMLVSDIVAQDLPEHARQDLGLYCSCIAGAISEKDYCKGLRGAGLTDVEIRERIEYDREQLKALLGADIEIDGKGTACCGGDAAPGSSFRELAAECAGKVWSAKIYARKPSR
jgi:SAM-dependent methyltransferase